MTKYGNISDTKRNHRSKTKKNGCCSFQAKVSLFLMLGAVFFRRRWSHSSSRRGKTFNGYENRRHKRRRLRRGLLFKRSDCQCQCGFYKWHDSVRSGCFQYFADDHTAQRRSEVIEQRKSNGYRNGHGFVDNFGQWSKPNFQRYDRGKFRYKKSDFDRRQWSRNGTRSKQVGRSDIYCRRSQYLQCLFINNSAADTAEDKPVPNAFVI